MTADYYTASSEEHLNLEDIYVKRSGQSGGNKHARISTLWNSTQMHIDTKRKKNETKC